MAAPIPTYSKLSASDVSNIRGLMRLGYKDRDIAQMFSVSNVAIRKIRKKSIWPEVAPSEPNPEMEKALERKRAYDMKKLDRSELRDSDYEYAKRLEEEGEAPEEALARAIEARLDTRTYRRIKDRNTPENWKMTKLLEISGSRRGEGG